ncbi:MAG: ATP-binding protein [Phycisphaerales bacterium]|nr:ATP-binding protein [Phycisphaerales bacterium]
MSYKPRILTHRLESLIKRFSVVIVSGSRQVGKSTLLRHELPQWDAVVFDPTVDVGNARSDPDLFLDNHPPPLILDEIQYAPELVAAIKRRVDQTRATKKSNSNAIQNNGGLYILTGSQQWAVLKSASESLAGRAAFLDLEGFCLSEIAGAGIENHWLKRYLDSPEQFIASPPGRLKMDRTLNEQLWRGFLPEADALEADWIPEFYRAYLRTYIERDVRLLSDLADWQQFGRFVQLAAALTAQEMNHSQLGRELGLTPQTAQRWLAMLRATFQWFETPAYHGNSIKRISGKSKGYIADTGLACGLQQISKPATLSGHPLAGALFETAVAGEIRKLASTLSTPPNIYHWRSHSGAEIDLLLERDGMFYPIEVKMNSHPTRQNTRGITAFRENYPKLKIAPGLVIAPTGRMEKISELDYCMPWDSQ